MKREERNKLLFRLISAMQIAQQSPVEIQNAAIAISDTERTRGLLEDMTQKFNAFQASVQTIFEHLQRIESN
ncbi:MAG: hypothetical protein IJ552_07555 [Prevotella sp.]|nr:hypothetical protein [Prevotella sp.]